MDSGAGPMRMLSLNEFQTMARAAPSLAPGGRLSEVMESFLRQVHDDADPHEVAVLSWTQILELAGELWALGQTRAKGERIVRLRDAFADPGQTPRRQVLEVVGPDLPFLVASIIAELGLHGANLVAIFHPIVPVDGEKVSFIQVVIDHVSASRASAIEKGVGEVLDDVAAANADFAAMRGRMAQCMNDLAGAVRPVPNSELTEAVAFLKWLESGNFTFLGAREYQFARDGAGNFIPEEPIVMEGTGLGILRDPDRFVLRRAQEPSMITPEIKRFLQESQPIVVSKSNLMSRVHRRVYADYVGVKRYDGAGVVMGETRFVGLFTAEAYNKPASEVPLIGPKVKRVLARADKDPASHSGKALSNIVETFPRDELFQVTENELYDTSHGILHLLDRPRPKVFVRRDRFDRFISVLVFVPRERFNTTVRETIGDLLARTFRGRVSASYPLIGDAPLARIHYIIGGAEKGLPDPDINALDLEVAALTRTWEDALLAAAAAVDIDVAPTLKAFTAAYKERFDAAETLRDLVEIGKLGEPPHLRVRAYPSAQGGATLCCKIYSLDAPLQLSACVPVLENLGLYVEEEVTFPVRPAGSGAVFIHDIRTRSRDGLPIDLAAVESSFEEAFVAIWTGRAENDGFNALILKLGISWRSAALIRALARFRQQTGLDPTQAVQEQALRNYPEIARLVLGLFRVRFSPELQETRAEREVWAGQMQTQIAQALANVLSLDEDRALRRIAGLVGAILRTNYYQLGADGAPKSYMSFKIASRDLEELPAPKPYREIWVSGPDVEGVHLRFGPVARGGLRWTDRRDDFRSEVLDLVKAQQVKNAIIVPVGAKGGFFPKKLPPRTDPGYLAAGVEAYKTFLRGLLDITDNIVGDAVKPPTDVVRWDSDDPYLVVAADKGTASFSDIANGVSADYGHWLGDAFASGGSIGYDHKGMGITAKGAWEAVKRHFREMGKDIQTTPFTVIGVGDMSGDVFGNGMLLSKQIRLIAAFDHRDIFIDPDPDPARSWEERKRLFDLPRSSWRDYDATQISKGGGVFSRSEKTIQITPEISALTGLQKQAVAPSELVAALLGASCELLWFGGIGTYVKAAHESHMDVSDKANDAHRVDGKDVRALVIGEGANLGVTQAGREEYARKGGRINTDAIDNSAGVDTSDHEVNIKILLAEAERAGALRAEDRKHLLADMTLDVERHVLGHNYDQTRALSVAQASAPADLDSAERFMQRLEAAGKLSRVVEGLPDNDEIRSLRERKAGLVRPELAKLLAYAKIDVFDALVASDAPDDPHFESTLLGYFPTQLSRYQAAMQRHRLRREIISTCLADDLVNMGGPTFVDRVRETLRAAPPAIAVAFEVARTVLRFDTLSAQIDVLDNKAPAATQIALHQELARALTRATIYLVRRSQMGAPKDIATSIAHYRPAIDAQRESVWEAMTEQERQRAEIRAERYITDGAPRDIARETASLAVLVGALDVTDMAARTGWPVKAAALVFRTVGAAFGLDRLRGAAAGFTLDQHWDRLALRRTLEELYEDQRLIAEAVALSAGAPAPDFGPVQATKAVEQWIDANQARASGALIAIRELEASGPWTFAKAIIAGAEIRVVSGAA